MTAAIVLRITTFLPLSAEATPSTDKTHKSGERLAQNSKIRRFPTTYDTT
jgi:hypothetical protein